MEATGATPPDPDLWPGATDDAIAVRRNRAVALTHHEPDRAEASFMRRGRGREALYTVDSVRTYSHSAASNAVTDIRRYLRPR